MKKILTLITFTLASFGISNAQDCDLPGLYSGNTGANMTVMLTPGIMGSLPTTEADAYMVAFSSDGLIIGSATVGNTSQTTIAVWGDDSSTTEVVDGALAAESISFQLVNGTSLYDVVMPVPVSFTTNGLAVQAAPATVTLVDCSVAVEEGCLLPSSDVLNTGANMTVMLLPDVIASLNTSSDDAYLVALSSDGNVVGSVVVGIASQTTIAVWGDDASTAEVVDGALAGESISFQLVDGTSLYDVVMPSVVSYTTNGMVVQASAATVTVVDCSASEDIEGCMDATANNYDATANVDDTSCTYDVLGCTDATANNYDATANVDDTSCTYDVLGCTDATANNYDATANVDDASCTYDTSGTAIEYQLSAGWNMVGYTGTSDNNGIVAQMDAALENSAGTANTFSIIKDVSGSFWTEDIQLLTEFTQGKGYMMYVNGSTTTVNFQHTTIPEIDYDLTGGWNMVAFTGDVDAETAIVTAMDAALVNGAGTANTFSIIKDVSGSFWTEDIQLLTDFIPGKAYMMYVNGSTTTINFQQE